MTHDELPLTGGDVDEWGSGLAAAEAGAALVLAGLAPRALSTWSKSRLGFLAWHGDDVALGSKAERLLHTRDARVVTSSTPPVDGVPGLLRLQLDGNVIPTEVVPRLLQAPTVASVVLPAVRPAGALRRRRWHWPARVAVHSPWVAEDLADVVRRTGLPLPGGGSHRLPVKLIDLHQVGEVGAVDVVVLDLPLTEAVALLDDVRTLANAVIVLDRPRQSWPVIDAQLASLRAATGAVASVLGPPLGKRRETDLATILGRLIVELSHAQPFDVAATTALGRDLVIVGETEALVRSDLATATSDLAQAIRQGMREGGAGSSPGRSPRPGPSRARAQPSGGRRYRTAGPPGSTRARPPLAPPPPSWPSADALPLDLELNRLEGIAHGEFLGERHEASAIPDAVERVEELLRDEDEVRFLQATVGPKAQRNVLREGPNRVSVFIGPHEQGTLRGPALGNTQLGFDSPQVNTVRLTLVLVPLSPRGEPSRTEIDVPRFGRSEEARLTLHVPPGQARVEARLVLLHWNRVVQTAVLSGTVGGDPAELTQVAVVHPAMDDLETRRPFDTAFLLNHDGTGTDALIRHSNGHTWVDALPEIDAVTNRIRKALIGAAGVKRTTRGYHEKLRTLVIELALNGRALFNLLEDNLGQLSGSGDPKRIQVVTARAGRFLPLELVYPRVAPADDAVLCAVWKAGGADCGDDCFASETDDTVVCPAAFWGLSRVIERQYVNSTELNARMLLLADPKGTTRKRLTAQHALVAASAKVAPKDVKATLERLGAGTRQASTWEQWVDALADPDTDTDLLVLMPHTIPDPPTLEISSKLLRMERLEEDYVTGRKTGASPLVLLLGCDTAGSEDHPAGFCSSFMQKHAAVVFSTLTMIHVSHAPALSQLLVSLLRDDTRKVGPLGELVMRFRREALQAGLVSALAVTAYGDADKKV
jgi:hypothetical protein